MKTQIMNPIYDATFKYLMQDIETASHVFTILLGQKTQVLHFLTTEIAQKKKIKERKNDDLSVNRMDFVAQVQIKDRSIKVILEIQKSTYKNSIARFSNYVGQQYSSRKVVDEKISKRKKSNQNDKNNPKDNNLPIISVYLLGENLEKVPEPFTQLRRVLIDAETKKEIPYQRDEDFLELLSHDMVVVQIKRLSEKTKKTFAQQDKKLRSFFTIFDQKLKMKEHEGKVLMIDTEGLDDETIKAVERLNNAMYDQQLQYEIQQQHNFDTAMENDQKMIEYQKKLIEEERKAKEEAKQREMEAQKEKEEAQQREMEAKQREREKSIRLAIRMLKDGESIAVIMEETELTEQEILQLKP